MYFLRKVDSRTLLKEKLDDLIISFDKRNMKDILQSTDIPDIEKKRRKSFKTDTFILAYNKDNELIAYLEYGPSWDSKADLFISSLQIEKKYRGGFLLARLILEAVKDVSERKFKRIIAGVQKNNKMAIKIYHKLGFNFTDKNEKSFLVFADRNVLVNNIKKFKKINN